MELTKIEELLEKYFEGVTTVEEEQVLQTYFSQDVVVSHLQEYQPMFQYFAHAGAESPSKEISLKPHKRNYQPWKWFAVAASVAVLVTIYIGNNTSKNNISGINDPEVAYKETKKALTLIAQNLNKGAEKIAYLEEFEKSKNKIFINN